MFQTRTFVLTFQQDVEYLSRIGEISPDFEFHEFRIETVQFKQNPET